MYSKIKALYIVMLLILAAAGQQVYADQNYFDELIQIYKLYGNEKYMLQEQITQQSHILQAAHIAKLAGAPEDIIIGLLFHDVGQVAYKQHAGDTEYLHQYHDDLGAKWLKAKLFPQDVIDLIQFHTLVKVVLCEQEHEYCKNLSTASKISYKFQQKKYAQPDKQHMVTYLKNHNRLQDYFAARRCDEMAKIALFETNNECKNNIPQLTTYRAMAERVRLANSNLATDGNWRSNVKLLHSFMKKDQASFEDMLCNNNNIDYQQIKLKLSSD